MMKIAAIQRGKRARPLRPGAPVPDDARHRLPECHAAGRLRARESLTISQITVDRGTHGRPLKRLFANNGP